MRARRYSTNAPLGDAGHASKHDWNAVLQPASPVFAWAPHAARHCILPGPRTHALAHVFAPEITPRKQVFPCPAHAA